MKHSGVEWIGEMPKEWRTIRFKYLHDGLNTGEAIDKEYWSSENDNKVFYTAGLEPIRTSYEDFPQWKYTEGNDLLLARNGTPYVYYPEIGACYTDHIIRAPLKKGINRRYVQYILQQSISAVVVETVSIATWSASLWNKQVITWPTVAEQQRIADYLDAKCAKIDALIAKQQEIIEKLKAYKLSVITEAVTKGLNPNVPMKDSGVEWIGDIPQDWKVSKMKYLGRFINGFAFPSSDFLPDGIKVLKIANIQPMYISWEEESFVDPVKYAEYDNYRVESGDLVFALTRPIINGGIKVAIARENFPILLNQRNAMFKGEKEITSKWQYYLMQNTMFIQRFALYIDGTGQQPNISTNEIAEIPIPVPSVDEQYHISAYLDRMVRNTDIIINYRKKIIDRLIDYKKSIIYEVVTGKREV